ncbi:MAG: hypothetical protein HY369_00525 [Candidatus Aenigmarchaeota archaeon]|nr:hypothetical protein [Candidatus Aenigmarchaeota archaeon]
MDWKLTIYLLALLLIGALDLWWYRILRRDLNHACVLIRDLAKLVQVHHETLKKTPGAPFMATDQDLKQRTLPREGQVS